MTIDWTLQIPASFDVGHIFLAVLALVLLVVTLFKGDKNDDKANSESDKSNDSTATPAHASEPDPKSEPKPEPQKAPEPPAIKESAPDAALQLLSLFQKEARLIDFVKEDLTGFSDQEVGAAARVVHQGSKKLIEKHFDLVPVRSEEEESALTVEKGFNPQEIRLTGNLSGEAPFSGVLVHKGWRAENITLPQTVEGYDTKIIAPAEVEV